MASVSWKNVVDGNWTDAADWNIGTVPGAADDATLGLIGAYTVSITTGIAVDSIAITGTSAALSISTAVARIP